MKAINIMDRLSIAVALFFASVFCVSLRADAAVTTIQALSFGEWISLKNDMEYEITVNTDGSYSADPEFIEVSAPQEGIYDIENGFTPFDPVASVVVTQQAAMTCCGNAFTIDALQETHSATVGADGKVRVTIGGTANSTGNSSAYIDGTYNGTVRITINF